MASANRPQLWVVPEQRRQVDRLLNESHTDDMTTPVTTELLDAKLENIELKMDARVQRIEDNIGRIDSDIKEIKSDLKSMKWWMIGTAISTVLGVAAFNATVLSNMVASFESGKNTAQSLGQTQQELQKREQRLDSVEKKLDQLIAAPQK